MMSILYLLEISHTSKRSSTNKRKGGSGGLLDRSTFERPRRKRYRGCVIRAIDAVLCCLERQEDMLEMLVHFVIPLAGDLSPMMWIPAQTEFCGFGRAELLIYFLDEMEKML